MIPAFNDDGYLPAGVHPATLDEIAARFGMHSEVRAVQMESIRWLATAAQKAGVLRLVINGSFVTDALEPDDVDCVILPNDTFPQDSDAELKLLAGVPFLEIAIVDEVGFAELVERFFATDRSRIPKGMVEVML